MKTNNINRSFYLSILPFVIVVLASTISFKLSGVSFAGGDVAFVNDPRRLIVLGIAYSLGLVAIYNNIQHAINIMQDRIFYICMLFYVLLSMLWSDNSVKVFISFGHFVGVFLTVIAATVSFKRDKELTFAILSGVFSLTIALSIFVSITNPSIGLHFVTGRWQGVSGNPNTLGIICIIAVWINTTLFIETQSTAKRILVLLGISVCIVALVGARSMSSILVAVAMSIGIYMLSVLENKPVIIKYFTVFFSFLVITSILMSLYIVYPEKFTLDSMLGAIGKDSTFTGRTSIWDVALLLIKEKPLMGYSFDSLLTAFNFLGYTITQFHNGYLDLLVRGGWVALLMFFFLVIKLLVEIKKLMRVNFKYSISVLGMLFAVLVHNFTEASIMRNSHILWTIFVFLLCSVSATRIYANKKS